MQTRKVMPGATHEVTQRARNVAAEFAETVAPKARPIIAGFQHNDKPEATPEKHVSTDSPALPEDIVRDAIRAQQAKLRAYRHKAINGIGNPVTVSNGIRKAEAELARLRGML
jgi:hypothetical protein